MPRRISYLSGLVLIITLALAGTARADGTLGNDLGGADAYCGFQTQVDIEDYVSVYRFVSPTAGSFDLALYDERTPLTAANFRGYADRGDYTNTFIHRSVDTAGSGIGIVQGGGFTYSDADGGFLVNNTIPPVQNEPGLANATGTIALAKTSIPPTIPRWMILSTTARTRSSARSFTMV